jgi:hypothetical protein
MKTKLLLYLSAGLMALPPAFFMGQARADDIYGDLKLKAANVEEETITVGDPVVITPMPDLNGEVIVVDDDVVDDHDHEDHESGGGHEGGHNGNGGNGNGPGNGTGTGDGNHNGQGGHYGEDGHNGQGGGGGHDDGDDHDHDDGDDHDHEEDEATTSTSYEQKYELKPLFFFDGDLFNRIVNLSSVEASSDEVMLAPNKDAYKVTQFYDAKVGLGARATWRNLDVFDNNPNTWSMIGLAPVLDEKMTIDVYVNDTKELDRIKSGELIRPIPWKADAVKQWKTGESIKFRQLGGVAFNFTAGNLGFGASTGAVIQGGWQNYVQKSGDEEVVVRMMRTHIDRSYLMTGHFLAQIANTQAEETQKGFSYRINLSDKAAAGAYEDMLNGNLVPIQEIAENSVINTVTKLTNDDMYKYSDFGRFRIGIPFINVNLKSGKYYQAANTMELEKGTKLTSHYGVYLKSEEGRFFGIHRKMLQAFYGGKATTFKNDKVFNEDMRGQFIWKYEADHSSSYKLNNAFKSLMSKTGLRPLLAVDIPEKKRLGYTSLEMKIDFPKRYTNMLMADVKASMDEMKSLESNAYANLKAYFNTNMEDVDDLCNWDNGLSDDLTWSSCENSERYAIKKSFKRINKALRAMNANFDKDPRTFAMEFAKIGKAVWKSPFVFKAFFESAQKCGLSYAIDVKGEKVAQFKKAETFNVIESCN